MPVYPGARRETRIADIWPSHARAKRPRMEFAGILTEGGAGGRPECPHTGKRGDHQRRSLALPDLEQTKSAVLNSLTSKSGQRTYDHAINEFVDWYCSEPRLAFNRTGCSSIPNPLGTTAPRSNNDQPPLGRRQACGVRSS